MFLPSIVCHVGSPPHTRGKGSRKRQLCKQRRITPAHAGKSFFILLIFREGQDHPRTRGEKGFTPSEEAVADGSLPHTRGKEGCGVKPLDRSRITPAHAGKRGDFCVFCAVSEDHPRTRGEKSDFRIVTAHFAGITPAHAGKSRISEL